MTLLKKGNATNHVAIAKKNFKEENRKDALVLSNLGKGDKLNIKRGIAIKVVQGNHIGNDLKTM